MTVETPPAEGTAPPAEGTPPPAEGGTEPTALEKAIKAERERADKAEKALKAAPKCSTHHVMKSFSTGVIGTIH